MTDASPERALKILFDKAMDASGAERARIVIEDWAQGIADARRDGLSWDDIAFWVQDALVIQETQAAHDEVRRKFVLPLEGMARLGRPQDEPRHDSGFWILNAEALTEIQAALDSDARRLFWAQAWAEEAARADRDAHHTTHYIFKALLETMPDKGEQAQASRLREALIPFARTRNMGLHALPSWSMPDALKKEWYDEIVVPRLLAYPDKSAVADTAQFYCRQLLDAQPNRAARAAVAREVIVPVYRGLLQHHKIGYKRVPDWLNLILKVQDTPENRLAAERAVGVAYKETRAGRHFMAVTGPDYHTSIGIVNKWAFTLGRGPVASLTSAGLDKQAAETVAHDMIEACHPGFFAALQSWKP